MCPMRRERVRKHIQSNQSSLISNRVQQRPPSPFSLRELIKCVKNAFAFVLSLFVLRKWKKKRRPSFHCNRNPYKRTSTLSGSQSAITFSNPNDVDVRGKNPAHDLPLLVAGFVRKQSVRKIIIDNGSSQNIVSLSTITKLGISSGQLEESNLEMFGFDGTKRLAAGKIVLDIRISDMDSTALFHVIDAETPYSLLLGRQWIHGYGVVPSTLHQCFKYCKHGRVKTVVADKESIRQYRMHEDRE